MTLVVLSHQLIAMIMFIILIATLVNSALKKKKTSITALLVCSIPAVLSMLTIFYLDYFTFSSPLMGYSANFAGGFEALTGMSQLELAGNTLGFLAFCYLPLLPLIVFGYKLKKNIHLHIWIAWVFILVLVAITIPNFFFIGGVMPYRWILLLTYPLSFIAVEGLSRIKWGSLKKAVGLLLVIFSVAFVVLPSSNPFIYYDAYLTYVPKTMVQNTLPLSDCQSTTNALAWAQNNLPSNASLLVHEAFYGWAYLSFDNNRIIPYFFETPTNAINNLQNMTSTSLYLIWWVNGTGWYNQPTVPASFQEIYHSENIAIYHYTPPLSPQAIG
jgi:hypothetical protein